MQARVTRHRAAIHASVQSSIVGSRLDEAGKPLGGAVVYAGLGVRYALSLCRPLLFDHTMFKIQVAVTLTMRRRDTSSCDVAWRLDGILHQ